MEEKDRKYLTNLLEAAKDAAAFAKDKVRSDLDQDRQLTLSLLKCLEIMGHAAALVSKECQLGCEPVPWEDIIQMKQQVVHTYWDIDRDWIWERVTRDLPTVTGAIEELLAS